MLIYQPFDKVISALYYCNTLTTNNHHSRNELHEQLNLITSLSLVG